MPATIFRKQLDRALRVLMTTTGLWLQDGIAVAIARNGVITTHMRVFKVPALEHRNVARVDNLDDL